MDCLLENLLGYEMVKMLGVLMDVLLDFLLVRSLGLLLVDPLEKMMD